MFKNLLNHVWRKPENHAINPNDLADKLHKLEHHYIIHVGPRRCDLCHSETNNCFKTDIADNPACLCPRKDIRGFRRPQTTPNPSKS